MRAHRFILFTALFLAAWTSLSFGQAATVTFTYDRPVPPRHQAALITDISVTSAKLAGYTVHVYSYDAKGDGKQNEGSFDLDATGNGTIQLAVPVGLNRLIGLEFTTAAGAHVVIPPVIPPGSTLTPPGSSGTGTYNAAAPPAPGKPIFEPEGTTAAGITLLQLNGLPFSSTTTEFFETDLYDQFVLQNSSSTNAYDFTELKLYYGLDPVYFNSGQFSSPSAIATANGMTDILGASAAPEMVKICRVFSVLDPRLAVSFGPGNISRYQLLVGKARPYLGNNQYGSEIQFAVGSRRDPATNVPTLSQVGMIALALMLVGGAVLSLKRIEVS
jgi:hypothetical protein